MDGSGWAVSYTHLDVYKRQTQRGDIVAQRIDPDIHGALGVKGNGDAPLDRGAGNTGVLQALLDKGDHLVLPALGLEHRDGRL